jgi:hypothetical protein
MLWIWVRDFGLNVLANIAAGAASPTEIIWYAVALAFGFVWLVRWHRARNSLGKRGMDSLLFISLSLAVAVMAVGCAAYGIGLRSASKTEIVLSKPTDTAVTPAVLLSPFEWGFEKYPGYDFIGMSADSDQKLKVHFFQAQGHNRTGDPITKVDGYIRSDRTGQKFPIYFNVPPGATRATASELNPIPIDSIIDVRAPFLPNDALMPMKQFLADIVPFTFFFEYDGKTYRRSFTLDEIEPFIRRYEQEIRKSAVQPPQMSKKEQPRQQGASVSPRQLLTLYENRTPLQADKLLQPYKGTQIESEGTVLTILSDGGNGVIGVLRNGTDTIECRFSAKWRDVLSSKEKGDRVGFRGTISESQNGSQLYVSNCEVL